MSIIDKQLTGTNLCNLECTDNNKIIHPETCVNQVLLSNGGTTSLVDWVGGEENVYGNFTEYLTLLAWLQANYPLSSYTLPVATNSTLGGVKIDTTYLTIDSNGLLGIDISSLDIPTLDNASFSDDGIIKLGNNTVISNNFANSSITETVNTYTPSNNSVYSFPLRVDSNNRAGITIPVELFDTTQIQVNWNQSDTTASDYIKNKPELADVATSGSYNDLLDTPTIPSYTAGSGINVNNNVISQTVASDDSFGGIKTGYTETSNLRALRLDNNNKAYVKLKDATGAWISNGMSQHYFRTTVSTEHYIPLLKIEMPSGYSDFFKVNVLFRIIGRHAAHYNGTFYINIKNRGASSRGAVIASNIVSDKINSVPFLQPNDIVVCFDNEDETSATVYRRKLAGTLGNAAQDNIASDTFIVDILGNNDVDGNDVTINNFTYYCTESFSSDETVITSSDFQTGLTTDSKFTYIYNTTSASSGVTSITTGAGLAGGTITETGTIKANLSSETSLGELGETSQLYAIGVDDNNKLCVNVPWTTQSYTAGSNVSISELNVISATDTTYSQFGGTTGSTEGTSGLVPGPATTDAGKYLKADGTWSTPTNTTYGAGTNISISGNNIISATIPVVAPVQFITIDDNTVSSDISGWVTLITNALNANQTPVVYIDYSYSVGTDVEGDYKLADLLIVISHLVSSHRGHRIIMYINDSTEGHRVTVPFYKSFLNINDITISGAVYNSTPHCTLNGTTLTVYKGYPVKLDMLLNANGLYTIISSYEEI